MPFVKTLLPLALLVIAIIGCRGTERQQRANSQPTVSVSATTLYAAYEANEVSADGYYRDKNLRVTGTVESIGKDILDSPYVVLSSGKEFNIGGVQCMFDDNSTSRLAGLSKGQIVTLTGLCQGKSIGSVLLKNCRF